MKEEYLHYLWKTKNIPHQNLTLTDGRPITISAFGILNHDSGPDFSNGKITIDGITWIGNIEMHINASDWYIHQHHLDKAYENVVLHVVYNYDKSVYINEEEIPTLELKKYISNELVDQLAKMLNNTKWIPCFDAIKKIDKLHVQNQIDTVLFQRLERKSQALFERFKVINFDLNQLISEQLAAIIGTNVNRIPMLELVQKIPINTFFKESKTAVEAILLDVANLLPEHSEENYIRKLKETGVFYRNKYKLNQMNASSWKFFGMRKAGFPTFRIAQFSSICSQQKFFDFLNMPLEEWLHWFEHENFSIDAFWETHYHFKKETKRHNLNLSKNSKSLILINVLAPILYFWGIYQNQETFTDKALELLENIPREENSIIKNWKEVGLSVNSAKDSQGLLELKNEFCAKKKCLSCKIGHQVLKQ
jgi:hypothetical protein